MEKKPSGAGHCGGSVNHFDLSTKAYKVIGSEKAGVIHIQWRQVPCEPGGNIKLTFLGNSWWFKV